MAYNNCTHLFCSPEGWLDSANPYLWSLMWLQSDDGWGWGHFKGFTHTCNAWAGKIQTSGVRTLWGSSNVALFVVSPYGLSTLTVAILFPLHQREMWLSEAIPESGDSWRLPANRTPSSWGNKFFIKEELPHFGFKSSPLPLYHTVSTNITNL